MSKVTIDAKLSKGQKKVLLEVALRQAYGAVTLRSLAEVFGCSISAVHRQVEILTKKGWVESVRGKKGTLRVCRLILFKVVEP